MSDIVISISSIVAHAVVQDAIVSGMVQACLLMLFFKWSPGRVSDRLIVAFLSCVGMLPVMLAVPSWNALPMCGIAGCMVHASVHHVQEAVRKKHDDGDVIDL